MFCLLLKRLLVFVRQTGKQVSNQEVKKNSEEEEEQRKKEQSLSMAV